MREPVNLSDSTQELFVKMSEGNPGALNVLMELLKRDDPAALMTLLSLDDMNMRGPQIWVGYKDHCESDIEIFAKAISDRDPEMIATVNSECYRPDLHVHGYTEKAVTHGASFETVAGQRPDIRGMGF